MRLANSQFGELKKFLSHGYPAVSQPVHLASLHGQESEEERNEIITNPPDILLTNYVMLELILTRPAESKLVQQMRGLQFLVFDELHTYRGRQGSDVSILIRRIKSAAANSIICIGTSATMVSSDATSLLEQKQKVAEVASTIFGSDIQPEQVVSEYLVRSIGMGHPSPSANELREAILKGINESMDSEEFEKHPTANWIEEQIALELKDGVLIRRKPIELTKIAEQLATYTGSDYEDALEHVELLLEWANRLNTNPGKQKNYLPYRIHQFIAQTGSVYSTLGDQDSRELYMDAGLYADDKEINLYPMVFSRTSGHEFSCVKLNLNDSTIQPREFYDIVDEEEGGSLQKRDTIFIQHKEDERTHDGMRTWDNSRFAGNMVPTTRRDGNYRS